MSDKALPALTQQLIARLGKSGDAAGILTLFAHMAEIEARLTSGRASKLDNLDAAVSSLSTAAQAVAILAYVDDLESRLTAARAGYLDRLDAAVSSRAAAATALLNTMWTDARAGKLDLIGAAADAAGQNTLFAYMKRLEAFVDDLESRLTATRAGYLDLLSTINTNVYPWRSKVSTFNSGSAQPFGETTLVEVSGAGFLMAVSALTNDIATTETLSVKVYADNNLVVQSKRLNEYEPFYFEPFLRFASSVRVTATDTTAGAPNADSCTAIVCTMLD